MDLTSIESFLEAENERLRESLPGLSSDNVALAQTVKLSEEVGELGHAVLETNGLQRSRDGEQSETTVEMELADVIITALLLGETLDIDVDTALDEKMARIEARYE